MKSSTKKCKHCKSEIDKKAKVCPHCQKKQGGIVKWIVIGVIVLALIGSMGGGDEETNETTQAAKVETTKAPETTEAQEAAEAPETTTTPETTETETEEETTEATEFLGEGDTFDVDGLEITIDKVDLDYTDYEDEYGWYDLDDGLKYVMVSFTYVNNDNSDRYVSIYDYDCYADGTLCEQQFGFEEEFMNANLSATRNVSFGVYFIVPEDAESVELEYTENIFTGDKVIIKLQ